MTFLQSNVPSVPRNLVDCQWIWWLFVSALQTVRLVFQHVMFTECKKMHCRPFSWTKIVGNVGSFWNMNLEVIPQLCRGGKQYRTVLAALDWVWTGSMVTYEVPQRLFLLIETFITERTSLEGSRGGLCVFGYCVDDGVTVNRPFVIDELLMKV